MRGVPFILLFLSCLAPLAAQSSDEVRRFATAQALEKTGDVRGAAAIYLDLHKADTLSDTYFEAVRRTYSALGLSAELLPLVERRIASHKGDHELRVLYADLLYRAGKRPEAATEWRQALDASGFAELITALVAQSQIDNRAYEAALATFRAARMHLGDNMAYGDQVAQVLVLLGRFDDAMKEYLALLRDEPERLGLTMRAIASFMGNPAGAAAAVKLAEDAANRYPDSAPLLELLSWIYSEQGNNAGAFDLAKRTDEAHGTKGTQVFAYADRALRDGRTGDAIGSLKYFLSTYGSDNPLYPAALLAYANAVEERDRAAGGMSRSDAEDLVDRYRALSRSRTDDEAAADALLHMARIQASDLGEADDAHETLAELFDRKRAALSTLAEARLLEGDVLVRTGDTVAARGAYLKARRLASESPATASVGDAAALRFADLLLYSGRYREAVDSLTQLTRNTSSDATNDALSALFLLQENLDRNEPALGQFFAARLNAEQRRWEDAEKGYAMVAAAVPGSSLAEEALYRRAIVLRDQGRSVEAAKSLVDLVAATPNGLYADRALFTAAEITERSLGNRKEGAALYTRILEEYPRSTLAGDARKRLAELSRASSP